MVNYGNIVTFLKAFAEICSKMDLPSQEKIYSSYASLVRAINNATE